MTKISFIVPVRNDALRLSRCLAAIVGQHQGATSQEMIVADNGSNDGSVDVADDAGARVLIVPDVKVSQLRNEAAAIAQGPILAFIDADHQITPNWASVAAENLADPTVGAVGALYSAPPGGSWVQRAYAALRGATRGRRDVTWLGSGNLAVRREAFDAISGFHQGLEACEDVDLCKRLRTAGWRVVADERLHSTHFGDPVSLAALFRAELWRGRDNLRVSLSRPISARDAAGAIVPLLTLAGLILLLAGLALSLTSSGLAVATATAGASLLGALVLPRSVLVAARASGHRIDFLLQILAVLLTYDIARGLALVVRAPHHRPSRPPRPSTT